MILLLIVLALAWFCEPGEDLPDDPAIGDW